jgi:hypothetical protein
MHKFNKPSLSPASQFVRWVFILACILAFPLASQAAKVLYVQNGFLPSAVKMISILKAQGHDVTVWTISADGNTSSAATYASQGYQLLIVDEIVGSGNVGASFRGSPIPVINWEGFLYSGNRSEFNADAGLTGGTYADGPTALAVNGGLGADFGQVGNETNILIMDSDHPLAAGLGAGLVAIFDPAAPGDLDGLGVVSFAGTRTFTPNVQVVATVPNFSEGMCVWGVPAGVLLPDATTSQARWVHLPWNTTAPQRTLIEPSYFLFEAAVAWALTNAEPVKIYGLTPEGGSFLATNTIVSCTISKTNNAGSAVASGNITVKVNGAVATSGVSITDGGTVWNVSYTNGFALDKTVTVTFSATSADGGLGARQTTFDTFSTDNFTWEAEDFNFDGGAFFDSIVLCDTLGGGTPGCYFDRISVTNVDFSEVDFTVTVAIPTTNEVYRFGDLSDTVRDVYVDTFLTADAAIRSKYTTAGIPDYEVRNVAINEWLNYTRTYPTGTYNIYARVASAAALTVQLDFVDNGSNTVQNLTKIGRFVKSAGTAGYEFVRLTDDGGTLPIVVQLTSTNPTTIRATALTAGYTPNYFMLVPTTLPPNEPPTVTLNSPTNGATLSAGVSTTITCNPTDTDGTITNVQFFAGKFGGTLTLVGEDNAAPWEASFSPANLGVMSFQTLRVIAKDNGGLQASAEVDVRVVDPAITRVSTAVGNGADAEMRENQNLGVSGVSMNTRTSSNGDRNEMIALRFDLSGYTLSQLQNLKLNVVEHRNNGAREVAVYGVTQGTAGLDGQLFTTENWSEANLTTWGSLPGLEATDLNYLTQSLNTNSLVTLITNQAYTGSKADVDGFSTPALTSFVTGYTGSSLVTFIIAAGPAYTSTGQGRVASKETVTLDANRPAGALGDFAPFLSFTVGAVAPQLSYSVGGGNLTLSWTAPGYKLIVQTNSLSTGLGSTWSDYPAGASSPVIVPIDPAQGTVFFGLAPNP